MKQKLARHRVNFEDAADLEAVVLAKLGFGNDVVKEHVALSDGQIQYRLNKAKSLEGLEKGQGYRKQWRQGKSELAHTVMQLIVPEVRKELKKTLPPLVAHPTPATVPTIELATNKAKRHAVKEFGELTPEVKRMGNRRLAA